MNESIPRDPDPTAAVPPPVTFCLWWGPGCPPQVVGRDADDAERRLLAHLTRFYAEEAETPVPDPDDAARGALDAARGWGLSVHVAPDEEVAFAVWLQVSMLTREAALRRWRAAFPVVGDDEPLATAPARDTLDLEPVRALAGRLFEVVAAAR